MSGKAPKIDADTCEADILDFIRKNVFRCNKRDTKHPRIQGDGKAYSFCLKKRCPYLERPVEVIKACRKMSNTKPKRPKKFIEPQRVWR